MFWTKYLIVWNLQEKSLSFENFQKTVFYFGCGNIRYSPQSINSSTTFFFDLGMDQNV